MILRKPKSLFVRSLLILLVPFLLLQLVVGRVFIERHFERVTEQMARSIAIEVEMVLLAIETAATEVERSIRAEGLSTALEMEITTGSPLAAQNEVAYFDLSGRVLISYLDAHIDAPVVIDLQSENGRVRMTAQTDVGPVSFDFDRERVSASNPHQLLVLMVLTALLLAGIATIFLRNQMRPIRDLAYAADEFGRGRSAPLRIRGASEIRRAGTAFLAMRERIDRQIEQRTAMLSGISHDMRTPLTRMKLSLAMMEDGPDKAELEEDVETLSRMIESYLDFARGEGGEEREKVDPAALAREMAEQMDAELFLPDDAADPVRLRPLALRRALQNLLANAERYGDKRRLTLQRGQSSLSFVVEDNGPGIAPEDREAALKPFSQLDESRNQDRGGGVGLGLAIALDVARAHGGSLRLEDSADLGGLRAVLTIPC
ncbi:ATP-binding protein [Paracoccaceae bacterium GXU_MW_L88]